MQRDILLRVKPIRPLITVIALLNILPLLALSAAAASTPATLDVISGDYPHAFFFRLSEAGAAQPANSFEKWDAAVSQLMGIEGKTLDEEIPGRSLRNIEFFTRFKKLHPSQLALLHYNGNARDPRDIHGKFFAGHWVYYNGARILSDIPAAAGQSVIRVSDATLFLTGIGRYKNSNEDIGLCELTSSGKPDWSRSEQVKLISVDRAAGTITVERGQYDTAPRAFAASKAYAAAHMSEGPWGNQANLLWFYNHSLACPKDSQGRTANDCLVDDLAHHFATDLAALDGLEFDVLHNDAGKTRGKRGPDTNGDGLADDGIIDGRNAYGEGTVDFIRKLRARLGEARLILADGWNITDQRAFGLLNGVESEGWPTLRDYQVDDWSGGLNRQGFWVANSRPPVFNYINHKFNINGEVPGGDSPLVPMNIDRLVFAGAVFTDSAICYSLRPPSPKSDFAPIWDELRAGTEHRLGWLGKPRGPAIHLATRQPDVWAGTPVAAHLQPGKIVGLPTGEDIFLEFTMHAAGPTLFHLGPSYAWVNEKPFEYTLYLPSNPSPEVALTFEGNLKPEISSLRLHRHPDAMYREFERGIVIANPSPRPYTFDLTKLAPGRRFRRLHGSPEQDPKTNNGGEVSGAVVLQPKDALFLIARARDMRVEPTE